jgi:hypothetical protein
MPVSRWLLLAGLLAAGCDRPAAPTTAPVPPPPVPEPEPKKEPPKKELPPPTTERVPISRPAVAGTVRVSIKKVTIGQVPMKEADGSTRYTDEPRLMVALRIENLNDRRGFEYASWVPDLETAPSVGKLTDDTGAECKRVTLGFGNNVKDRSAYAAVAPGGTLNDVLVFEVPAATARHLDLDLPGANCKVKGAFRFRIEMAEIAKVK